MNCKEFEKSMIELGATKLSGGFNMYIEVDGCSLDFWYNDKADVFYIDISTEDDSIRISKDIIYIHTKEQLLSFGIQKYGELKYELGKKDKAEKIRKALFD